MVSTLTTQLLIALTFIIGSNCLESPRVVAKITSLPSQVSVLGEAPFFVENEQALYYVDIPTGEVVRHDVVIGTETKIDIGDRRASVVIPYAGEPYKLLVGSGSQLLKLDWRTQEVQIIAEVFSELGWERFNDAKCDALGRLFIGTILDVDGTAVPFGGSLYRLDGNTLVKVATGFTVSNGMSWSNDAEHGTFFFNDSGDRKTYAFKYNITDGSLSDQRVLIDVATHPDFVDDESPDGMAIDQFGFIWVAMFGGGRVVKINPDTARVVDEVKLPRVKIPTSLAFGRYKGEYGLYVTSASIGLDPGDLLDGGKVQHVSFQGGEIKSFDPTVTI